MFNKTPSKDSSSLKTLPFADRQRINSKTQYLKIKISCYVNIFFQLPNLVGMYALEVVMYRQGHNYPF